MAALGATDASKLVLTTVCGTINLVLRPDAAPVGTPNFARDDYPILQLVQVTCFALANYWIQVTCEYISKCAGAGLYDGTCFYRSDFVIQCGLHGSGKAHSFGDLPLNETASHVQISNTRGTAAIAHFDVPDSNAAAFP